MKALNRGEVADAADRRTAVQASAHTTGPGKHILSISDQIMYLDQYLDYTQSRERAL